MLSAAEIDSRIFRGTLELLFYCHVRSSYSEWERRSAETDGFEGEIAPQWSGDRSEL